MRIALATVGTGGDVRPFAALARELVDRGHTVTGITWPMRTEDGIGTAADALESFAG